MMNQFIKHNLLLPLLILPILISNGAKAVMQADATYAPYQIVNGGFETGDFTGWTKSYIWKGESGMYAFDNTLITNGTYFSSNPYNRDGSYNLGITSGSVTWDQSTERMGYLRSTNFVLGGSGWMSFKMGAARYASFAYISVRKSADDTEVARFGNRWWNNTGRATTVYGSSIANAEAFLFPYYFNLTTVTTLGTGLYIQLCDTSSYDWSIISADSFVTYYATAPTPVADAMAYDIKPAILGIDTATNSIKNPGFDSNLDNWSVGLKADGTSEGNWAQTSGHALSNQNSTGDGGMGCLRSSAFTLTPNNDMQINWGGGIANDKRIFMSIKEVGTNIEKLRFVRRDNLSGEQSNNFNNHLLDTSGLDNSKKYYIEFADNKSDGWGVNEVDTVNIISQSSYNGMPSGDRAVSVSGMATTFPATALTTQQEASGYGADFINETQSYCTTLGGNTMSTDGKWTALASNYASLSSAAKDYFVNAGTTDTNVVAARNRYVFLIGKYTALHDNNFMVSSTGTVYHATVNGSATITNPGNLSSVLIVILGATVLAAVSFLSIRKKRSEN